MVVFDASTLILTAKADLLDLFLTSVNVPVPFPVRLRRNAAVPRKRWMQ